MATLTDNGSSVIGNVSGNTYTITDVTAAHNVVATFAINPTVNTSVTSGNGSITPTSASIAYGGSSTLTITPTTGYFLSTLTDNGVNVTSSVTHLNTYTITNVAVAHNIVATFATEAPPTVPALGPWGVLIGAAGLGALMRRRKRGKVQAEE